MFLIYKNKFIIVEFGFQGEFEGFPLIEIRPSILVTS